VTDKQTPPVRSGERIIAFMIAGIIGLSVVCIFAILIGALLGVTSEQYATGLWPIVRVLPIPGFIAGFVLIFVLLFMNFRRRAAEAPKPR
jgi:uncharacterized RDD family membrane protein YckC